MRIHGSGCAVYSTLLKLKETALKMQLQYFVYLYVGVSLNRKSCEHPLTVKQNFHANSPPRHLTWLIYFYLGECQ